MKRLLNDSANLLHRPVESATSKWSFIEDLHSYAANVDIPVSAQPQIVAKNGDVRTSIFSVIRAKEITSPKAGIAASDLPALQQSLADRFRLEAMWRFSYCCASDLSTAKQDCPARKLGTIG